MGKDPRARVLGVDALLDLLEARAAAAAADAEAKGIGRVSVRPHCTWCLGCGWSACREVQATTVGTASGLLVLRLVRQLLCSHRIEQQPISSSPPCVPLGPCRRPVATAWLWG